MGGTKQNPVPYPTFHVVAPVQGQALAAVGRCRLNPLTCTPGATAEFQAIVEKNLEQAQVDEHNENNEHKKWKKKYMKQGVALAQSYLSKTLHLDTSIIDIEILLDIDTIIASEGCLAACFLDGGCDKIALHYNPTTTTTTTTTTVESLLQALHVARIPKERVVVHFDDVHHLLPENTNNTTTTTTNNNGSSILSAISEYADAISWTLSEEDSTAHSCIEQLNALARATKNVNANAGATVFSVAIQIPAAMVDSAPTFVSTLHDYFFQNDTPIGTVSLVDPTPTQLGTGYVSCIRTDRPDGLYTTVVCTRSNEALGLVYSSAASVIAALACARGVYYSRSRNGLWRKGDTSGHYQNLHRIDSDCDGDALRFTVTQRGGGDGCAAAFCHLNKLTCWEEPKGLRHLEGILQQRLQQAPPGSYTQRLFEDEELLRDKLVEEAQELSEAQSKQHVAEELADVLYFALVKAAKAGVSIDDAVVELDNRARKVTRRKGDSKSFRIEEGNKILHK